MNSSDLQARLQRLEGYLQVDPDNRALRLDAFETARQLADWTRAEAHAQEALRRHPDPLWRLRAGEVALAQLRWEEAAARLDAVRLDPLADLATRQAAEHQLAEVMLHTGRPDVGIELLSEFMASSVGRDVALAPASQVLWLRLLHRVGRLQDGLDIALRWETNGQLSPQAAGVGSLMALDLDRLDLAEQWSKAALRSGHRQFEALITRASVALGHADASLARTLLSQAVQAHPRDGRSWSMLAFTELLEEKFDQAKTCFETAVRYMPEHVGTWHGLGWTLIMLRDFDRARNVFERAIEMDRNFAEGHGGLAVALALAGDRESAGASAETARRLDRNSMAVRYAEAVLAGDHQNLEHLRKLAARSLAGRGPMADQAVRRLSNGG